MENRKNSKQKIKYRKREKLSTGNKTWKNQKMKKKKEKKNGTEKTETENKNRR